MTFLVSFNLSTIPLLKQLLTKRIEKARWAVTNRTNVAKILESTGTSITTKGSFYAAGKEPGPNENPKLYILVEGDTEVVVHDAMRELMRLLKEGTMSAADAPDRTTGRYSVV
jgi:ATP-dependent RNA helicase DDX46/PRP5